MSLTLPITDPTILADLECYPEEQRQQVAQVALRIGLQALRNASGTLDATQLQRTAERTVEAALANIRETFDHQFSTDHDNSAINRMVKISTDHYKQIHDAVKAALANIRETFDRQFSTDHADSAISRILKDNNERYTQIHGTIEALKERKKSQRETSQGGRPFEETLGEVLAPLANEAGDYYEATGDKVGYVKGAKVGDFVVTLGKQSHAPEAAIVIEAKRASDYSRDKILAECQRSRENRRAQVAVFVWDEIYGRDKKYPPISRLDDRTIVVLWSEDNPDSDVYVKAAYWLARGLCQPATQPHHEFIRIQANTVIDQIAALDDLLTKIKNAGTNTVRQGNEIVTQTLAVQGQLQAHVNTLRLLAQMQQTTAHTLASTPDTAHESDDDA